jgi:hypothetical protein
MRKYIYLVEKTAIPREKKTAAKYFRDTVFPTLEKVKSPTSSGQSIFSEIEESDKL